MKTQSAQAAALIRKELKAAGINARVRSRNFSMGCAVDIDLIDAPRETYLKAQEICAKYQYGKFNGMEDIYEYTNSRKDIPQAKYVHVRNQISDEKKETIYQEIRSTFCGGEFLPPSYSEGCNAMVHNQYVSQLVWQQFNAA